MLKGELEAWRERVLAAGERWARALDADEPASGEVGRARDDLRAALGLPSGCYSTGVPASGDDEGPTGVVERLEVLAYEVPTLNRVRHLHWSKRRRVKAMLRYQLASQLAQQDALSGNAHEAGAHYGRHGRRTPAPVPRRCHFTIRRRRSNVDFDNIVGGCKDLVDCVEAVGLIWEDSPLWFRPSYAVERCDPAIGPCVVLEVWDVPQTTWTEAQARAVERAKRSGEQPAWVRKDHSRALAAATEARRGR